jgi:hypothetical protein
MYEGAVVSVCVRVDHDGMRSHSPTTRLVCEGGTFFPSGLESERVTYVAVFGDMV